MSLISRLISLIKKSNIRRYSVLVVVILVVAFLFTFISARRKAVTLIVDGKERKIITYKSTVGEALKKEKISLGLKDKVEPELDKKLEKDSTIVVKRAVKVNVVLEGKELNVQSAEENVELMLKAEGIMLNSHDKIKPDIKTKLSEGMKIEIVRVEIKTITENRPINFKEVVKVDRKLANTKRKVTQEGKTGEKQVTIEIVYENGNEVSRKVAKETIIKKPIDRLIVQGTYPLMPVSRGGRMMSYKRVFKARATAYWAVRGVGRTYTASGRKAVRDPDGYSTIAVDPKMVPYGTRLFVEGYGFAIAADTGSAIKGEKIDVYFNTYREACNWAVKYVKVYILE